MDVWWLDDHRSHQFRTVVTERRLGNAAVIDSVKKKKKKKKL